MVAMFSSATMMSTGTPNSARQARYLAESGMRYAVSKLRADDRPSVIRSLNETDYTLPGSGSFELNVFGKWFEASADYPGTFRIQLNIPEGTAPGEDIFSIPQNAYLVNLESYRDSFFFGGGAAKDSFFTKIYAKTALSKGAATLNIVPEDTFSVTAAENHKILLAVTPSSDQTEIAKGDDLKISYQTDDDWNFLPKENGSFYVIETDVNEPDYGVINRYYYESLDEVSGVYSLTNLTGTKFPLDISQANDLIILSERNRSISAAALTTGAGAGGNLNLTMDFKPNIISPQPIPPPPPMSLPPDISPSDFFSADTATPASTEAAVSVDKTSERKSISLGGGESITDAASAAAWYGGDLSIGGFKVCDGGVCKFNNGVRAFFVFDYEGLGGGFTFTLANGNDNSTTSYGGTGRDLGYAGTSPTEKTINKPKMAIEFDTYTNSGINDPGPANKDYVQYIFWGGSATDVADDNTHDTGGEPAKKWERATVRDVRTKPVLNSDGTALYVNADAYLYALDPDTGAKKFSSDYFFYEKTNSNSSPALDSSGYIIMGENYDSGSGYIDSIKPDISGFRGYEATTGVVDSSPVIDDSGVVYFGTNDGYFYAIIDSNIRRDTLGDFEWLWYTTDGKSPEIRGTPALSLDEKTVYFVTKDKGYLYALNTASEIDDTERLKWKKDLEGNSESSPRVAADGTIYVGSDSDYLYAITDNTGSASQKWRYKTDGNVRSRPAVGPDGTVYVGSDDNKLHAVNPDGIGKWTFPESGTENVKGSPLVHEDGTIWFGSDDDNFYVLNAEGVKIAEYPLGGNVQCEATQGTDGVVYVGSDGNKVFAFTSGCQPRNRKTLYVTYEDLPSEVQTEVQSRASTTDDWLSGGPWAARVEIERKTTPNDRSNYEYTLKMWLRQCKDAACTEDTADRAVLGSYFQDTRIAYDAKEPYLMQTVELCGSGDPANPGDHENFDTFIFGYTEATGDAPKQSITITDTQLSFRRPGDFVVTDDPDWP
jgi:outer membrane protein assembly factor BamB